MGEDRGVSETVGFVLVFSLVITTIGFTYTMGFGALQDVREDQERVNMRRAFDVVEANVDELYRRDAPSRSTQIQLTGGTLHFGEPVTISVRAERESDPGDNETFTVRPRPLVYAEGDTAYVYVAGAVFRADRDGPGAVMLDRPGFRNDSRRAVVPLLLTYPRGSGESVAGRGTVLLVAHRTSNDVGTFDNGTVNVTLTVESPRVGAWKRYLESKGYRPIDADASDGTVTYYFTTDRLYVPETVVEFELHG